MVVIMMLFLLPTVLAAQIDGSRFSISYRNTEYTRGAKAVVYDKATKSNVIITPSLPINYNGINYYWYGKYTHQPDHPQKCEYIIDENDKEFQNMTLPDGSKPESIQFGCLNYQDCCGLECCGDNRNSTVVVCIVFLLALGAYALYENLSKSRNRQLSPSTTQICPGGMDIGEETV